MIKNLILIFSVFSTLAHNVEGKTPKHYKSLHFNVKKTGEIKKSKQDYYNGIKKCSQKYFHGSKIDHIGKCLEFHNPQEAEKIYRVPLQIVSPFDVEFMSEDINQLHIETGDMAELGKKEEFKWGTAYTWSTQTIGSANYFYLQPKGKRFAVRLGPIAGLVLLKYDLNFKNLKWKF